MSTNALIYVTDDDGTYAIYKHWNGHPKGVKPMIERALELAWQLPRFEADEFAAAFVAANKPNRGDVRLVNPDRYDLTWFDYVYVIRHMEGSDKLNVTVGHCTGMDELNRITMEMRWVGYHTRLHEAYASEEDAA